MNIKEYNDFIDKNLVKIREIREYADDLHDVDCNQKYGDNLPYSYHLNMVGHCAEAWAYLVCEYEHHILPIIFGAYFHDAIEDARQTYNDIMKIAEKYMTHYQAVIATEIVYALTDEKGRNRAERGCAKHYEDIRNTMYAPFIKWCDRYANWRHSVDTSSRMADVYKKEMPEFIEKLGGARFVPQRLIDLIK